MTEIPAGDLQNRRVVVTRSLEQGASLVKSLVARGADVVHLPVVRYRSIEDSTALDAALQSLSRFDVLAVTSANAVKYFMQRAAVWSIAPQDCPVVAAIGQGTADAARAAGLEVAVVPSVADAEHLVQAITAQWRPRTILIPQASNARPTLVEGLRRAKWAVTEVVAYHSETAQQAQPIDLANIDAITFASSAMVNRLIEMVGVDQWRSWIAEGVVMVAIGQRTAGRLQREAGARVVTAASSDDDGLVAAVAHALAR